jgi:hypothetical protein
MPLKYNADKFDSCLNTYREKFSKVSNSEAQSPDQEYEASNIMPLDFSLEMDGISGIIPNSAFEVPAKVLPNSYLTKNGKPKIAFILHTIEQNFNNNKWTTKITGQTLNIRFDPLSKEEIARREAAKKALQKEFEKTYNNDPITNFVAGGPEARISAEFYLGRKMTDTEWTSLVAATFAEASPNQTEQAYVMAVMLNRARNQKKTITQILQAKNQFQSVTGTKADGNRPSANYVQGPPNKTATSIYGAATNILPKIPMDIVNFTSNNVAAYGPGTNIGYLKQLRKTGFVVGQTVFSK